jgi:hypothetical protein
MRDVVDGSSTDSKPATNGSLREEDFLAEPGGFVVATGWSIGTFDEQA